MLGYIEEQPERADVDAMKGLVVVQFGTNWCGHCRAAERFIEPVFEARTDVARLKVEDGKGRPIGRSFAVKLWPTLIFMKDGVEVTRLVRPMSRDAVEAALAECG